MMMEKNKESVVDRVRVMLMWMKSSHWMESFIYEFNGCDELQEEVLLEAEKLMEMDSENDS